MQVNDYNLDSESNVSFAWINAGDQSNSEQLDINITMSNPSDKTLQSNLEFTFDISCNDLESFDADIDNDNGGGTKTAEIKLGSEKKGELQIESVRPGLSISITIFKEG